MKPGAVEFRVAQPADALCIGVLAIQVFLDTYATDGIRPDLAREAMQTYDPSVFDALIRIPSREFLLAERNGHLCAFCEYGDSAQPPQPALTAGTELFRLYVGRHSQRQGIGVALLRRAEAYAAGLGKPFLWLTAWSGNANARAFYLAQGYADVGTAEHVFEGRAYENRVYRKMLDNAR